MTPADTPILADPHAGSNHVAQSGQFVLRLHGTSRDGEVIDLQSPKCTIGSDQRCTLRLDLPGIRPVHCLIIRGRQTTVVRRWSPDTRLNGSTFSDAELSPGDRLGIGPIEMEVLKSNPLPPLSQSPKSKKIDKTSEISNITQRLNLANRQGRRRARLLSAQLRDARAEIERLQNQIQQPTRDDATAETDLDSQREQLQNEAEQIEVQKRAVERQLAQWEQKHNEQEQALAERQARLDSREAAAVTREHQLDEHQSQIEAQRALLEESQQHVEQRETELEEDRHRIEADKAELEVHATQFEQKQQEWEQECRNYEEAQQTQQEQALSEPSTASEDEQARREELTHAWEDLEARKNNLTDQETSFEEEKQRWEAEIEEQRHQLEQQQEQLEEQRKRAKAKHDEIETRLTEWEHELELRAAKLENHREAIDESLVSQQVDTTNRPLATPSQGFEDDLATLAPKVVVPLRESEKEESQAEEIAQPVPPESLASSAIDTEPSRESYAEEEPEVQDHHDTANEDDESIDEYMAQLMRRLNTMTDAEGSNGSASTGPKKPATISRQAYLSATHPYRQKKENEEETSKEEEEEKAKQAAAKRAAAKRQRSTFENLTSLAAMRELATATASSAISTHKRSQLKRTSISKLSLSLASLALGMSLILGKLFWGFQDWQLYIGVVGIFLALLWVIQYAILAGRLTFGGPVGLQWNKVENQPNDKKEGKTSSQEPPSDTVE